MDSNYEIVFDKDSSKAALECLMNMVELERTPKFGSLKNEYSETNRYKIEQNNVIDSRYYTDKSTGLLINAIYLYVRDEQWVCDNILDFEDRYYDFGHDIKDNSVELKKGDIEASDLIKIGSLGVVLAVYNDGFELLNEKEEEELVKTLAYGLSDIESYATLKKSEIINGVEKSFYYLFDNQYEVWYTLDRHESYVNYIEERFSSDILKALSENANGNDIIILSPECGEILNNHGIAAYASNQKGHVVIDSEHYEDTICHEIGHIFDSKVSDNVYSFDYDIFGLGKWDLLANKYASDVYTIRKGADISCGYSAEAMEKKHREFYAEAFQLYFHSPETRAALPEKIRKTIEYEINIFTGDGK